MIILDTNVLSALMLRKPDAHVVSWLDQQPVESVWTTSITLFEVYFGIGILPDGRRRNNLRGAFDRMLREDFAGRVLGVDTSAAACAAQIAAQRRVSGRQVEIRDMLIAGAALSRRAALATRNTRHFEECGLELVNPWSV